MEVFRELTVTATTDEMARVVAEMETSLPAGWVRNKSAEEDVRALVAPTESKHFYCYSWHGDDLRPAATVALTQKSSDTFHVTNILPHGRRPLNRAEYNSILEDYVARVFQPTAVKAGLGFELTDPQAELERWMSAVTAEKLRQFSRQADKGTGAALPRDRERWNAFVLAAHREQSPLDVPTLERWLTEVEGWSPDVAEQLAAEYHYGRELLGFSSSRGGI